MAMRFEYDGLIVNVIDPKIEKDIKKFIAKLQKRKTAPANSYKKWTAEETAMLEEMLSSGASEKEIAHTLNRTPSGISIKLWHLRGKSLPQAVPTQTTIDL